jgi:hypothetical protein
MFPNGQENWLALYGTALLELDLQKMPERIALANKALRKRSRNYKEPAATTGRNWKYSTLNGTFK